MRAVAEITINYSVRIGSRKEKQFSLLLDILLYKNKQN